MLLRIALIVAALAVDLAAAQMEILPDFNKVINEGESFSYTCTNKDLTSTIQPVWRDPNGQTIPTLTGGGSQRLYTTEGADTSGYYFTRVQFSNFEELYAGTYTCAIGQAEDSKEIIFAVPITFPKQAEESSQRLLYNSTTASLRCTVNSNPEPSFTWLRGGAPLNPRSGKYTFPAATDVSDPTDPAMEHAWLATLQVNNVISTDTGEYTCQPGQTTGAFEDLDIQVIVQVRPAWIVEPQSLSAVEGRDTTIQCLASGNPDPTYTWLDENDNEIQPVTDKYSFQDDGEYFTIQNLELADENLYTCVASNDAPNPQVDTSIRKTIQLTVVVPPTLNNQDNKTQAEGTQTTMECSITRPQAQATLTWRRGGIRNEDILVLGTQPDNERVTITRNDVSGSLTLTIDNTQRVDEGPWTCYAESMAGDIYVSHFLFVEYQPQIDRSKTPSRVVTWVDNPANLTCTFDGYPVPSITWKRFKYTLNETDRIEFLADTPPGTSTVLINPTLEDFGGYYCEAKNSVSQNAVSNRQDLIQATSPTPPLNLQIGTVTSSTIHLMFDPPESDGELEILSYDVSYWIQNDAVDQIANFDNYTDVVLTGLNGQSLYILRVAAVNERGRGEYTNNVSTTTEDRTVPGMPDITSPKTSDKYETYDLTWEAPDDDGGLDIQNYWIKYSMVDNDQEPLNPRHETEKVGPEIRKYPIEGLNPGQLYRFEIYASNSMGDGQPDYVVVKMAGSLDFSTTEQTRPEQQVGQLGTTEIVAIVVAGFVILLILVDICCFCTNDCGLTMFICVQCFGKTPPAKKDEIEMGQDDYGKSAPSGEGPPTYQRVENGKTDDAAVAEEKPAEAEPLVNKEGIV